MRPKGEMDTCRTVISDLSCPLSITDKRTGMKISTDIEHLKNTVNQLNIYETLHLKAAKHLPR